MKRTRSKSRQYILLRSLWTVVKSIYLVLSLWNYARDFRPENLFSFVSLEYATLRTSACNYNYRSMTVSLEIERERGERERGTIKRRRFSNLSTFAWFGFSLYHFAYIHSLWSYFFQKIRYFRDELTQLYKRRFSETNLTETDRRWDILRCDKFFEDRITTDLRYIFLNRRYTKTFATRPIYTRPCRVHFVPGRLIVNN